MNSDSPSNAQDMADLRGDTVETNGLPRWSVQPFREFVQYAERLNQLIHLSMQGISVLRVMPRAVELVAKVDDTLSAASTKQRIQVCKQEAELAQREVDEGFPILHAQATIALWSALENAVRLFVTRWLENFTGALHVEAVQRLRVRIGEYENLDGEDRFFYIVDQLERELSAPLRSGVTRFETLLEPFQLSGPIDDSLRQNLFELNQVRNVLVHRGGKADCRLVEACPWLGFAVGDHVIITKDAFSKYNESVLAYAVVLIARVGERFGVDMSEFRAPHSQDDALTGC